MTDPMTNEIEREDVEALAVALNAPARDYALAQGWTCEKIGFRNINGSTEQSEVWFPPDCDAREREIIIETEQTVIGLNMWDLCKHDEPPPLADAELRRKSRAILNYALAQEARISALEAKLEEAEGRINRGERWYTIDGDDESYCDLEEIADILRSRAEDDKDDPDAPDEWWIYRTITIDDGGEFVRLPDVGKGVCIVSREELAARTALKGDDNE